MPCGINFFRTFVFKTQTWYKWIQLKFLKFNQELKGEKSMVEDLPIIIRIAIYLPAYRYSYEGNYALNVFKGVAGPEQNFEKPWIQFQDSLHFYYYFLCDYICASYKILWNAVPKLTWKMKNHSRLQRTFLNALRNEMFISLDQRISCWKQHKVFKYITVAKRAFLDEKSADNIFYNHFYTWWTAVLCKSSPSFSSVKEENELPCAMFCKVISWIDFACSVRWIGK